jgi:hypothetical protein
MAECGGWWFPFSKVQACGQGGLDSGDAVERESFRLGWPPRRGSRSYFRIRRRASGADRSVNAARLHAVYFVTGAAPHWKGTSGGRCPASSRRLAMNGAPFRVCQHDAVLGVVYEYLANRLALVFYGRRRRRFREQPTMSSCLLLATGAPPGRAFKKPSLVAARRNSSARALGMHDLGCVGGQRLIPFLVLVRNQPKYGSELNKGIFPSRHERVASGNCRDFRNPSVGTVSIQHHFVIVEAHRPPLYRLAQGLDSREIGRLESRLFNRRLCWVCRILVHHAGANAVNQ